jgi:D-alanyl-lipoteichoic acid acyltransferase DltB (MBOAT superfamily)
MLFNSFVFLLFFLVFFVVYWSIPPSRLKWQNLVLWLASYVFYGWWDWHYLTLIASASLVSFAGALAMENKPQHKKASLVIVVFFHIAMLAYFKYAGFFIGSLTRALHHLDLGIDVLTLQIALPVGISFFTFQSMSYAIDVYNQKMKASRNLVGYLAFISFFPQLVAGPIERASHLLPQIEKTRRFDVHHASLGMQLILWGLIKKMLIADACAPIVESVFSNVSNASWLDLWWAAFLFAIQIYGDFSAYSEMAMGLALLLGIQLMQNFHYPYFAANIKSFWKKWHISLTTWFKDYVFLPMGGNRVSRQRLAINVTMVFALSGLWHGANYTFLIWGLYHAALYLGFVLWLENAKFRLPVGIAALITFLAILPGWVFFRSPSVASAFSYIKGMCDFRSGSAFHAWDARIFLLVLILAFMEWWHRHQRFGLDLKTNVPKWGRWSLYLVLVTLWLAYAHFEEVSFIYFDF